jgi:hypothetical protein
MSSTNGNGNRQWLVWVLGLLMTVLGMLWVQQDRRIDRVEATATTAKETATHAKNENDTRWSEVLRRLEAIDRKLDQEEEKPRLGRR